MALHPDEMDAAITRNMAQKTGRTLEEWLALLEAAGPIGTAGDTARWLKTNHGLGHFVARIVARQAVGNSIGSPRQLLDTLFATATQRGFFERLREALERTIPNTVMTPCKTYAGFGNPLQYAVAKPDRAHGLLIGLAVCDPALPALEPAKGIGGSSRIRWKIRIATVGEIRVVIAHINHRRD
jgi:Domain of unknown function (DUF4287)